MKGFYSVRKNKCIHTNSFSSVGQSIITLLYFTFPISSIALVRFQEATFPPTGVFRILIQILPDPAPSSMNSCAKHKFLSLKIRMFSKTIRSFKKDKALFEKRTYLFTCLLNQKLLTIECSPKIFTKTETKCVF